MTPYIITWAILAGFALLYLALLATRPELLARVLGAPSKETAENEGGPALRDVLGEVQSLRDSLGQVAQDLGKLKTEMSIQAERDNDLASRMALLEQEPARSAPAAPVASATGPDSTAGTKATGKLADKTPAPKADRQKPGAAMAPAASPAATPSDAPAPAAKATAKSGKTPADSNSTSPVETGSVEARSAAPVTFGVATVKPAEAKMIGLKLATGPSVDSLRLSWNLLSERNESLKRFEPRYITGVDATGLTYDLIAGPIGSVAEAQRLCKDLAAKAVPCRLSEFAGDAL